MSVAGWALLSELVGTAVLMLLGTGVGANVNLPRTKGHGAGLVEVTLGWGFAVFVAVFVAYRSGAHLNPAVTLGLLVAGEPFHLEDGVTLVAASVPLAVGYMVAQIIGALLGSALAWACYRQHYALSTDPKRILGTFATSPAIRHFPQNFFVEVVGTFVLVFWIIVNGPTPQQLGPLAVALVVVVIGIGLGGATGYAINPARDLGARLAHAIVPIPHKGNSDWEYAWIPVSAPMVGGLLGGLAGAAWLS